jgi:4'-phosphopantetheinyl transferase
MSRCVALSTVGVSPPGNPDRLVRAGEAPRLPRPDATALASLERGVVHVFWFVTDLPVAQLDELERLLDAGERARADRFRFARDRGRFIAARGRLRTLLGRYTGQVPGGLEFDTGLYGKPALRQVEGADRLQFNLSHADGVGVVAIGLEEELGIDVERIRPFDGALAIAARMFTGEEHRALRALPAQAQSGAFFMYWVRKEAVVKSVGRGLSHPLNAFGLCPGGRSAEHVELECDGVLAARWVLALPPFREGFVAALATAGAPPTVRCWNCPGE